MDMLSRIDGNFFDLKVLLELEAGRNIFPKHLFCPIVGYLDVVAIVLCDFLACFDVSCGNAVKLLKLVLPIGNHLGVKIKTMIQNSCSVFQVD